MAYDSGPGVTAKAVTPSDSTTIGGCRSLFVGGAGTVVCDFADGAANITFTVPAGAVLPVAPLRVKAASTATGIVAIY